MKRTKTIISFCAALLILPVERLSAQSEQVQLEERVTKLEKIAGKLPRISGFINMRYQYSDEPGTVNSFDIRRARLDFQGDIGKKFDYRLQVEFAGGPRILDAYFRWKISDYINLQAGEFKIPFTLENMYGPHQLETVDNSMAITNLCNYSDLSGLSANGRDIGLMLYGGFFKKEGFSILNYGVGIFNGNGINVRDNNPNKDFSGRIIINPIKNLGISASHYNGSTGTRGSIQQRVRTAAGALYDDGKLLVRSEYLFGKTHTMKSEGAYVVAAYYVHPKWQPLLKYDYFKMDKSESDRIMNYTAGLNYSPIKYVRLQLNYTYRNIKGGRDINYGVLQIFGLF